MNKLSYAIDHRLIVKLDASNTCAIEYSSIPGNYKLIIFIKF
jgi:hypothetical protein